MCEHASLFWLRVVPPRLVHWAAGLRTHPFFTSRTRRPALVSPGVAPADQVTHKALHTHSYTPVAVLLSIRRRCLPRLKGVEGPLAGAGGMSPLLQKRAKEGVHSQQKRAHINEQQHCAIGPGAGRATSGHGKRVSIAQSRATSQNDSTLPEIVRG